MTYLYDAALFIREQGYLALQPILEDIEIPFLRDGFSMLIDNQPASIIKNHLNTKMDVAFQAEMAHVKIYESAAGFAPTMGILGAVIGLVKTLGTFGTSPELIGKGVASAFMATLFGVGLANLFLLPVAGKLAERARQTRYLKSIMLVGILSLERGENPALVKDKLSAFQMTSARWDEITVPEQDWQETSQHAQHVNSQAFWGGN